MIGQYYSKDDQTFKACNVLYPGESRKIIIEVGL